MFSILYISFTLKKEFGVFTIKQDVNIRSEKQGRYLMLCWKNRINFLKYIFVLITTGISSTPVTAPSQYAWQRWSGFYSMYVMLHTNNFRWCDRIMGTMKEIHFVKIYISFAKSIPDTCGSEHTTDWNVLAAVWVIDSMLQWKISRSLFQLSELLLCDHVTLLEISSNMVLFQKFLVNKNCWGTF